MAKKYFAVISENEIQQQQIAKKLVSDFPDNHYLKYDSINDFVNKAHEKRFLCVIIGVNSFEEPHLNDLVRVSDIMKSRPVLLVAKDLSNNFRLLFGLLNLEHAMVIEEKYEFEDLNNIIQRITNGSEVFHRAHCRYPVDINIRVEGKSINDEAKLLNLSLGGAQLEIRNYQIKKGQVLNLVFENRPDIKAKVSWVNPQKNVIGVKFSKAS